MAPDEKKAYKKRVIKEDSDEESDGGDQAVPQPKRPKAEPDTTSDTAALASLPSTVATATTTFDSTRPPILPPPAALEHTKKAKLDIFTTGSDDESEDEPLSSMAQPHANGNGNGNSKKRTKDEASDGEDGKKKNKKPVSGGGKKAKIEASSEKKPKPSSKGKKADSSDEDDEEDVPLSSLPVPAKKSKNARASTSSKESNARAGLSEEEDVEENEATATSESDGDNSFNDSDAPLSKKKTNSKAKVVTKKAVVKKEKGAAAAKVKKEKAPAVKKEGPPTAYIPKSESASPVKKVTAKQKGKGKATGKKEEGAEEAEDEEEEEKYKWWEAADNGELKWTTLEHNGIIFPPEYEAHDVKMKYEGKSVVLPPEAEEVASFFAAILETDYPKNPVFVKNFFDSFVNVMKKHPPLDGTKITTFAKCDFTPIFGYLEAEKEKKKGMSASQKKVAKAARDILEEPYKHCLLDGRKEKVGNFRVEPPGLFRGRGEHPKTGLLKTRVLPEQITINIGKDAKVPPPPPGHAWADVIHDNKVTWLATWKENINGAVKYVFLAAGSSLKGQSDFKKFEKARALKEHVDRIRIDYTNDLKDKEMAVRQRATAVYFIDRFALRNGNEKGEEEAETYGCCSLLFEHVTLTPPTRVEFNFLGKDSIRYVNEVEVDPQVFKNLKIFKKGSEIGQPLFDRVNTGIINKYLASYMDGLTAKVFRTYNASWTFVQQLKDTPRDGSIADKILAYNRANRLVAVLCNHQRSVSKGHAVLMDKMADKLLALKYQRKKLRCALLATSGNSKKFKEFTEDESDLEDDWIDQHEINLVVLEREKISKKFEKDNKKLEETGEKIMPDKLLQEKLQVADVLEATLKAEKKKGWKDSKLTDEKLVVAIRKMDERIIVQKTAALDRDEGKEISLGTSKINYLDPRITVKWALEYDVPLPKLLSKTLCEKFAWAVESTTVDFDW